MKLGLLQFGSERNKLCNPKNSPNSVPLFMATNHPMDICLISHAVRDEKIEGNSAVGRSFGADSSDGWRVCSGIL